VPTEDKKRSQQLRQYQARQVLHAHVAKRRGRDQVVWSLAALGAVVVSSLSLWAYQSIGPGAPETVVDASVSEFRSWSGEIAFDQSDLTISLDGALAPQAVANFVDLTQSGFYEGLSCHRLTTEGFFVLQCGDPLGMGFGGPGYFFGPLENEPSDGVYPAGTIAMARAAGDAASMGSQFFLVYEDSVIPADAAGGYTVFGRITSGLEQLVDAYVTEGVLEGATDGIPVIVPIIESITIR
jgi:peptidyl-prolyl cis-trans isomerase B (cyclophilin B)